MVVKLNGMVQKDWISKVGKNKGPNAGIFRIDLMIQSLGKVKILQTNGKEEIFDDSDENRDALAVFKGSGDKPDVKTRLRTKSQRYVAMKEIVKTPYFGGGGGVTDVRSMSATKRTELFESLQCLYCVAMTSGAAIKDKNDVTIKRLELAFQSGRVNLNRSTKFKEIIGLEDTWHASSYFVAKGLKKQGYISSSYSFHRDDPIMNSIYKAKDAAFANNKITKLTHDKWNPGDIWAAKDKKLVTKAFEIKKDNLNLSSVEKINNVVAEAFKDRTIMGISLKQVKDERKMKLVVINDKLFRTNQIKHKFTSVKIAGKTFFSMQGGHMIINGTKVVDVRPANALGALNMEMILKGARGGRAGQGAQMDAAKNFMNYTHPDNKAQKLENDRIKDGNEMEIDKFWKMVETIQKSSLCTDTPVDEATFRAEINNQDKNVIHAKKATCHMFLGIVKASKKQRDDFVDYIGNYMESTLPESSVYLKAYQT